MVDGVNIRNTSPASAATGAPMTGGEAETQPEAGIRSRDLVSTNQSRGPEPGMTNYKNLSNPISVSDQGQPATEQTNWKLRDMRLMMHTLFW